MDFVIFCATHHFLVIALFIDINSDYKCFENCVKENMKRDKNIDLVYSWDFRSNRRLKIPLNYITIFFFVVLMVLVLAVWSLA